MRSRKAKKPRLVQVVVDLPPEILAELRAMAKKYEVPEERLIENALRLLRNPITLDKIGRLAKEAELPGPMNPDVQGHGQDDSFRAGEPDATAGTEDFP